MRPALFLSLALLLGLRCTPPASPTAAPPLRAPHALPWLPISLLPDTTRIPIGDFLAAHEALERVTWEDGSELPVVDGEVVVTQQPENGLGFIALWVNGEARQVPVLRTRLQAVTYRPGPYYQAWESVQIKGSFTSWAPVNIPVVNGQYAITFHLPPGQHPFQLALNGEWQTDPGCPRQPNGFGAFNSILDVPVAAEAPALACTAHEAGEHTNDLVLATRPGAALYGWWENHLYAMPKADEHGAARVRVPAAAYGMKRTHLRIWAADSTGVSEQVLVPLEHGVPIESASLLTRDDRWAMVMYFLMIDRFVNGDPANDEPVQDDRIHPRANHHGGDFAGIEGAIEDGYFESLGVNTVWVSPITTNPDSAYGWWSDPSTDVTSAFSGYHGYWPIRSTQTDRRFGSMDEFNALVGSAHDHGLNVLVDYVANHVHEEHPAYQQHPDWATNLYLPDGRENTQLWDEQRLTTWFDTFMPTLDFSRPEVVDAMTDSALWWVEHTEIDGFRHDATKHIPEAFWRTLTAKVKAATGGERNVFQIGETYGSPELIASYLSSGMLDAQFDFNHYDTMVAAFADDSTGFDNLVATAEQSLAAYGAHHLMGNITGNQDRPRFASLADGALDPSEDTKLAGWTRLIEHNGDAGFEKMRLLTSYLFSIPGVPCIYYGDELAYEGGNDPDNRKIMRFVRWNEQEQRTHDHAAEWAHLRTDRMSMMYGATKMEEAAPGVLRITRQYLGEVTEVWINKTGAPYALESPGTLLVGEATDQIPARTAAAFGR